MEYDASGKINKLILDKIDKIASDQTEKRFLVGLLEKELIYYSMQDPPVKRDFELILDKYYPFKESEGD